ncbi:hypothetical protein APUTEX25_002708 [Auxenochlorella protothecoides]|uniref:G-patch domain-containing protein n=1 Tax=Auxenochlorella protothecoides TaxID=3075 RepID=A0A3M7L334_AUXPR|nr:hypothetical protein APUTEX25_002708 [Auxenochlorella protothecoides]|eukprot:RMZ56619.1 hypothetical protein APUTEX25_002708 [Auxenochlorella protothecoides]
MASALLAPVQRYQGVQKESAGYKLLSSMGWKEGDGLGATGQGIKEHIRVKKKFENWGVGAVSRAAWEEGGGQVESADRARDWSAGMLDFHRVLSNLSEVTSQHATSGDSSDGSGSESDAEEAPAAEATPAPAKPAPPKPAPPKPAPKSVSHQGRFKRRESAKDVRQYTSGSLQAILGGVDPFAALAAAQARPEVEWPSAARSADAAPAPQVSRPDASARPRPAAPPTPALPRTDPGAWWAGYFERSGRLGSAARRASPRPGAIAVHNFSEGDQEALFTRTHDGATQGRVGLGRAGAPKKVAGTRWAGTKTRLDSEDEGEEEAELALEGEAEEELQGVTIVMPPGRRPADPTGGTGEGRGGPAAARNPSTPTDAHPAPRQADGRPPVAPRTVKWKKLTLQVLQGCGKPSMRLSKLVKAVAAAAGVDCKGADVAAAVAGAIAGSRRLCQGSDGRVSLG